MGPTRRRHLAALGAGLVAVLMLAAPAAAQEDPYGSTSTTHATGPQPSCRLDEPSVTPGSTTVAHVHAAPRGSTVRIFFDGEPVAEAQANGPGSSPQVNIDISYTVPDVDPGSYEVTAVGATFTASCGNQSVEGETVVGGKQVERDSVDSRGATGGLGGSLPRTGLAIGMLLAAAVALILGGRALLDRARLRSEAMRRWPRSPGSS
jgi:hypothetical protein